MVDEKHDADGGRVAAGDGAWWLCNLSDLWLQLRAWLRYAPNATASARAYVTISGNYAYRYPPFYTPDYNGYFGTYQSNGGGNG